MFYLFNLNVTSAQQDNQNKPSKFTIGRHKNIIIFTFLCNFGILIAFIYILPTLNKFSYNKKRILLLLPTILIIPCSFT